MNRNNLLCIYLVTAFLLYDLHFDITWLFGPHNHFVVHLVMAALNACTTYTN